jgi:hypothetical protein
VTVGLLLRVRRVTAQRCGCRDHDGFVRRAIKMRWTAICLLAYIYLAIAIAVISYQPGRFWAFQWAETGVFLAAALMLAGFCFLVVDPAAPSQPLTE